MSPAPPPIPTSRAPAPSLPPPTDPPRGFLVRLLLVLGPPAVVFLGWWLTDTFFGTMIARESLIAAGAFLTIVGANVIFGEGSGFGHLTTWNLVGVVIFMSVVTAFFWTYNLDLIERLPGIGPTLRRSRAKMARSLANRPWVRRLAVFGVAFFIVLPLPGSGTMGGSVLGRILGLKHRATFFAVAVGGILVAFAYGWLGEEIQRLIERYELGLPAKIGIVLGLLAVLWLVGKAIVRLGRAEPEPVGAGADAPHALGDAGATRPPGPPETGAAAHDRPWPRG